jgi:glycine oxidase
MSTVIIGAGVIGLSLGCELARCGRQVTIVERDLPGAGASSVAGGMLAPTSEVQVEHPQLLEFGVHSLRLYPDFIRTIESETGIDCGFRTDGALFVALTRDDEVELDHIHRLQLKRGLTARRIDAGELLSYEPHLSPRAISGLWVASDLHVDPRALLRALTQAFAQLGGTLLTGRGVERIVIEQGAVRSVAGQGWEQPAEEVVLAAGCWSSGAIESPWSHAGIRPVRGQTVRLRGPQRLRHVIRHPEVYLVPHHDDVLVGATLEEAGFDATPTAGAIAHLLRWAQALVPDLEEHTVSELPVGLRPASRDHLPLIGKGPAGGLFAATGHHRSGILLAPATARALSALMLGTAGATTLAGGGFDLTPFDPMRFGS